MSNGHLVFTADNRFEIFHAAKSIDWILILKRVGHGDAGIYECQVMKVDFAIILKKIISIFVNTNTLS